MGLFGKKKEHKLDTIATSFVMSPIDGDVRELSTLKDEKFLSTLKHKGVYVAVPLSSTIVEYTSPVEGVITFISPLKNVFKLKTNTNKEITLQIGTNSDKMQGQAFELKAKVGQKMSFGQILVEVNVKELRTNGCSAEAIVLVSSGESIENIKLGVQGVYSKIFDVC